MVYMVNKGNMVLMNNMIYIGKTVKILTRLSSDLEAATIYKMKGQSSNKRTGQDLKYFVTDDGSILKI